MKLPILALVLIYLSYGQIIQKIGNEKTFSCSDTKSALITKQVTSISTGVTTYWVGYRQVTSTNQDPIMARFDGDQQIWCKTDYEVTGDDSRAYGVLYEPNLNLLYAAFSSTGTQGTPDQDFRRFSTKGWLTSYGQGGGGKVTVLARINPTDGNVTLATFISSRLSTGNSNSAVVSNFTAINNDYICLKMDGYFAPRKIDKSSMTCTGSSPFDWRLVLRTNLSTPLSSCVTSGCDNTADCVTSISCNDQPISPQNPTPQNPNTTSPNPRLNDSKTNRLQFILVLLIAVLIL